MQGAVGLAESGTCSSPQVQAPGIEAEVDWGRPRWSSREIDRSTLTTGSKNRGSRGTPRAMFRYALRLRRRRVLGEEAPEVLEVCRTMVTLAVDRMARAGDARDFDVWVRPREPLLPT